MSPSWYSSVTSKRVAREISICLFSVPQDRRKNRVPAEAARDVAQMHQGRRAVPLLNIFLRPTAVAHAGQKIVVVRCELKRA